MKCDMCQDEYNENTLSITICDDCISSLQEMSKGGFGVICREDLIDSLERLYIDAVDGCSDYNFMLGFQAGLSEAIKATRDERDLFE